MLLLDFKLGRKDIVSFFYEFSLILVPIINRSDIRKIAINYHKEY